MHAKRVVFKSEPDLQEKSNQNNETTLAKIEEEKKENEPQKSKDETVSFSTIDKAQKYYENEQKIIFERQREKWIHNITKKYSDDLYQEKIEKAFQSLTGHEKFDWIDKDKENIRNSTDPYAALISKTIQHNVEENNIKPMTIDEINNLSIGEVTQRLQRYEDKASALENDHYLAIRKKAIRFIWDDAFSLGMIKDSKLGKNARYLNLMTDILINTYNQDFDNPHEWAMDFKLFSFMLFSSKQTFANDEYNLKLQGMLVKELFNEPGHLSTVQGKVTMIIL